MNIFGEGDDSWDSTPTQDVFIQNYFRKDKPSNDIVTKKSRKRKKHPLSSDTVSTSLISNYLENKTSNEIQKQKNLNKKLKLTSISSLETVSAKCNNKESLADSNVTTNFKSKSLNKNSEFKSLKPESFKIKMFAPKSNEISKEISICTKECSNDKTTIDKSSKRGLQNNNSPYQKVNSKKINKSYTNETAQNKSSEDEDNFQVKSTQNSSVSKEKYLNNESDNCENKVTQSKLQILKGKKTKTNKASQILNKPSTVETKVKTKNFKAVKKINNPKGNDLNIPNSDDSEDKVIQIERKKLRKNKSKVSIHTKTDELEDSENEVLINKQQNLKTRKSKTINSSQTGDLDDSGNEVSQNRMQKLKKKRSKTGKASTIKNKSLMNEVNFKTKKAISIKKPSSSNDEEDSEDDEVIRNELQSNRMFLKIQKLMKVAPHLNPNFQKDSEVEDDNLSCEEISTEDSSSDSDDEYSSESENEEVLKSKVHQKVTEDSSESCSDNSSNNDEDEDDSSENEEQDMGSQESHQATSKQEIPIPKLESYNQKTVTVKKPNSMLEKARAKLASAKFRFLNEKLYTESGGEAFRYFQENKEEFEDYHLGYGQQVSKWPLNPVDVILADLQKMNKTAVIADLGCGDAKIARVLVNRTVHSFDLVAMHTCVTSCDISKVPLRDGSVDVAVFCLSLMGVNLVDYLHEAYRILKIGGTLKIAEVESRIVDLNLFIRNLNSLGFDLERKNTKNKLFVFLDLKKVKKGKAAKATTITLRPCMYKKR